jgi:hypothetical protein
LLASDVTALEACPSDTTFTKLWAYLCGFLDASVKLDPFYVVWRHKLSNRYIPPITASKFGVGVLVSGWRVAQKLLKSSLCERRMSLRSG